MFLDFDHQKRFIEWQRGLPDRLAQDREHLSLLLLISGNEELERKVWPYYDPKQGHFSVDDMIAREDFSSGLEILARLAVVVFNQRLELNVHELSRLDPRNTELALHVLQFRYQQDDLYQRMKQYQSGRTEGRTSS